MRKYLLLLLVLTVFTFSACTGKNSGSEKGEKIKVFASILPLKYFIEEIGGDKVEVDVLVTPGKSPATYEPTPSQVIDLSSSDIFFRIGVPFEKGFIDNVESSLKNIRIKDVSDNVKKRKISRHSHSGDDGHEHHDDEIHEHSDEEGDHEEPSDTHEENEAEKDSSSGNDDPHIWLSLKASAVIIDNIRSTLKEADPENSEYYDSNSENLKKVIDKEYEKISAMMKPYRGKHFIVFHPSFGYFADEFGLVQIAVESGGKEPSPVYLEKIISEAREEGIRIIIAQPEFSVKSAEVIADAIDGKVLMLNPLNPDYLETINSIAEGIKEVFE